jgi:hypothetical protein
MVVLASLKGLCWLFMGATAGSSSHGVAWGSGCPASASAKVAATSAVRWTGSCIPCALLWALTASVSVSCKLTALCSAGCGCQTLEGCGYAYKALRNVCRCVQLSCRVLQRSLVTTCCSMQRVVGLQQSSSCSTAGANNPGLGLQRMICCEELGLPWLHRKVSPATLAHLLGKA